MVNAATIGVVWLTGCASSAPSRAEHGGLMILLPGVANSKIPLRGLAGRISRENPEFEVRIQIWGRPLQSLYNLSAVAQNQAAAAELADQITAYRRAHPDRPVYLCGYSGGGGVALLTLASLPADIQIDRLFLVAAAISPDYPITAQVLPHVREFVVNYASRLDTTVRWGTQLAGTIDRKYVASAGSMGFTAAHPQLLQVFWNRHMLSALHLGLHGFYLSPLWQKRYLVPLTAPGLTLEQARQLLIIEHTPAVQN